MSVEGLFQLEQFLIDYLIVPCFLCYLFLYNKFFFLYNKISSVVSVVCAK